MREAPAVGENQRAAERRGDLRLILRAVPCNIHRVAAARGCRRLRPSATAPGRQAAGAGSPRGSAPAFPPLPPSRRSCRQSGTAGDCPAGSAASSAPAAGGCSPPPSRHRASAPTGTESTRDSTRCDRRRRTAAFSSVARAAANHSGVSGVICRPGYSANRWLMCRCPGQASSQSRSHSLMRPPSTCTGSSFCLKAV